MKKSPTTYKSKWLNGSNKIEVATLLGTVNTGDQFSSAVDKAGLADIATQEVSSILSGAVPFIKAGNKTTHTTLKVGEPNYKQTVDQFATTLLGYLEDEIVTAQMIKHGAGSRIKGLQEDGSKLQFFDTAQLDFMAMKPGVDTLINDSNTTRKDVVTFLKDPMIRSMLRTHILNEIVKIQKDLLEYNVLRKDNKGNITNIGIDSNQLQQLRKALKNQDQSKSSTKLTPALYKKIAEQIYMIRTESLHEQFKVLLGHPALHKDLFKRTSGLIGPKKYPVTDPAVLKYVNTRFPPQVNTLRYRNHALEEVRFVTRKEVLETSKYKTEYLETLKALKSSKELRDIVSDTYSNMEIFDGGGVVTLDFYRLVRRLTDSWTQEHEDAYNNVIAGIANKKDVAKLDPLKPQVLAQALEDDIDIRIFNKFALFPIHPNLTRVVGDTSPRVMDEIHQDMVNNNLDYMVMESATKLGAKTKLDGEFETYITEEGDYSLLESEDSVQTYNLKFFGMQMDPKSKRSTSVAMGTQSLSMLLTNVFNNGRVANKYANSPFSETESWDEASQRFHNLNSTLIQRETQVLANKLGYAYNAKLNKFTQLDPSISKEMMRNTILEELERRDISRLMKDMIFDLFEGDVNLLNQVPEKGRLETIVNSIITNSVIRRKMNGDMVVLQSNFGYEVTNEAKKQKDSNSVIQNMGKLEFYRKASGWKSDTLAMQVYLPHSFKEFLGEEVPTELIDLSDPRINEMIGFRIPTEGLNSVEFIEVVGYLPQSAGSTIIVPSEMVAKSGADFDIDKLTLYIPNTRFVNGKMRLEPVIKTPEELRTRDLNSYKNVIITLFDENTAVGHIKTLDALYRNQKTTEQILKAFEAHPAIIAKRAEIAMLKDQRRVAATKKDAKKITKQLDALYFEINNQALHTPELLFEGEFDREMLISVNKAITDEVREIDEAVLDGGWEFLDFETKQTKEYLQNELQFFMKDVLRHPQSFEQLITPVGAHGFKSLAYEINELKNGVEKPKKLLETLSFKNIIETTRIMYQTLGGTGIVASSMTHAIKLQRAGVAFSKDHVFKFANKPSAPAASLSRVYSNEVENESVRTINSEMQQYVTGYVDGEKDPFVMYVNAGVDAAAVHMVLLRIGLPLKDVLYFMSQPIITDFLRMKSLYQGVALRSMPFGGDNYMTDDAIIENLSSNKKYGKGKTNVALTTAQLVEQLSLKLNSEDKNKKMQPSDKRIQRQILDDFLRYKEYAEELRKLQEIHSYDKIKLKNGSESIYLEAMEGIVKDDDKFINTLGFENLVKTRIKNGEEISASMLTENRNSINASNTLLGTVDLKNSNPKIRNFFVLKAKQLLAQGMFKADAVYTLNKFDNFITANLIQNVEVKPGVVIADLRYKLMQGPNSLPRRIKALQDSNEVENLALYSILPVLDTYVQGAYEATSDNIKLRKGVLDTVDTDVIADEIRALRDTNPDIYQDLIYFSILQSGVDFNPNAYYTILPAEDILPITKDAFNSFLGNNPAAELGTMWKLFLENNWDNKTITAQRYIHPEGTRAPLLNRDYNTEDTKKSLEYVEAIKKAYPTIRQNSLLLTGSGGTQLHFTRATSEDNWRITPKKGIRNKSLEATDSKSMYLSNQFSKVQGVMKAGKEVSEKIISGKKILSLDSTKRIDGLYTLVDGSVVKTTNLAYGGASSVLKAPELLKFAQEETVSQDQLALMAGYDSLAQMKKSKSYGSFLDNKKSVYLSSIELVSMGTQIFDSYEEVDIADAMYEGVVGDSKALEDVIKESEC
jgi:TfoX/Sxy family transcriptional regulator of competence genes